MECFVDFQDLNKACPKDSCSLPKIDQLVDATARHQFLSFMDTYSGYNHIPVFERDQEATTFNSNHCLFGYTVMSFTLKNTSATFQRLVMKMFKESIWDTMEVYIDDMIVKILMREDHLKHLYKAFQILRQHKMMLKLTKCNFEIPEGKFHRFIIIQEGIKPCLNQIKPLRDMPSSRTIYEIQRLSGRVSILSQFIP